MRKPIYTMYVQCTSSIVLFHCNSPIAADLSIFWWMRQQTGHNHFKMHTADASKPVADILQHKQRNMLSIL